MPSAKLRMKNNKLLFDDFARINITTTMLFTMQTHYGHVHNITRHDPLQSNKLQGFPCSLFRDVANNDGGITSII